MANPPNVWALLPFSQRFPNQEISPIVRALLRFATGGFLKWKYSRLFRHSSEFSGFSKLEIPPIVRGTPPSFQDFPSWKYPRLFGHSSEFSGFSKLEIPPIVWALVGFSRRVFGTQK